MSLNQIFVDPTNPRGTVKNIINASFKEVTIFGNIKVPNDGSNLPGYTLQSYAFERARFAPPPVLRSISHVVFSILSDVSPQNTYQTTNFTFAPLLPNDALFVINPVNNTRILAKELGIYLCITKISKQVGSYNLQSILSSGGIPIPTSLSASPYIASTRSGDCNYAVFTINANAIDTSFALSRTYSPGVDTLIAVGPRRYETPLLLSPTVGESTITFIKIAV